MKSGAQSEPAETTAISVIVRTLGSPRLAEALESLARQSRRDFEVVVVDMSGGRADAVAGRIVGCFPTVQWLRLGRPHPRPAALNAGIDTARSPRIGVLDDDNLYDPAHLERLIAELDASGVDYVYTGVRHATYTPEGRRIESHDVSLPFRFDRLILGNYIYATGSAFLKSLWERLGGYDERFTVFEDWDFIIRAAESGRVHHLPGVSGESRKFTGMVGSSGFDLEIAAARRCLAGIYWEHRRLYRGRLRADVKVAAAEHCRRRVPPRNGFFARTIGGWRLELGLDLMAWWGSGIRRVTGGRAA